MKQLVLKLKDGKIKVVEVPPPLLSAGMLLIKNHYSLISPGTEGSTVTAARKSIIGKAKERPQQLKQVLDLFKQQGPIQTYRAVMKKLDSYSPIGYSCAGEVIEVAQNVKGFAVGDLVACGGVGFANHAEIVAVPQNLCVKLPSDANLKNAAYNALGAIALQGVRQADLRIGEVCAVIGLGLIGQLTCLILRAGGIKVIGLDINFEMVEIARRHCTDLAFITNEPGLEFKIKEFTDGIGVDAVIITAATNSLGPVNLAGEILRKKGRVVIVGNVPTGFDRENYYKKELELRMSCSYGPGRYDINYEEKGIDYPVGYVRWTEKRNMQAFQELIYTGKINIDYLTTHVFKLEQAPSAYNMIVERKEPFLGILIEYDKNTDIKNKKIILKNTSHSSFKPSHVNIAFIGAGSYAISNLLPNILQEKGVSLKGVMTSSGTSSRTAAEKFGFEFCTSCESDIFENKEINTVFIATRHNTHAEYVIKSLKSGKHTFVEKPLCLTFEELEEIKSAYLSNPGKILMVGFNRRFSSLVSFLKEKIGKGPMAMIYRINAGYIPSDSWVQDSEIGGGRIIGEVCHFVDLLTFINDSLPVQVYASVLRASEELNDTINISLTFENGSIGTISYFSNGSKKLFKEYIEVYKSGMTGIIKDFKKLEIYGNGKNFKKKLLSQDKGQKIMVKKLLESIKKGEKSPIGFDEIYAVTLTTFKIIESIKSNKHIEIISST